mgnify:CR=1 FL=1
MYKREKLTIEEELAFMQHVINKYKRTKAKKTLSLIHI